MSTELGRTGTSLAIDCELDIEAIGNDGHFISSIRASNALGLDPNEPATQLNPKVVQ